MRQADRAQKLRGEAGFEQHYGALYGARWAALREALRAPGDSVEFRACGEPYFLDSGSVRCAVSLPLAGARNVLDVCAAPGGKTLVLASLMGAGAELVANERSAARMARLSAVCGSCLPPAVRARVHICCKDGATMYRANEAVFDRILLDAPCSSERHVLGDARYLAQWSPSRIKSLATAQWSLLSSAWRMLAPGGYLLYSTCALSPDENDGVVGRLTKKFPGAEVVPPEIAGDVSPFCGAPLPAAEQTGFGRIVLPDVAGGAGPLYFSLVRKAAGAVVPCEISP